MNSDEEILELVDRGEWVPTWQKCPGAVDFEKNIHAYGTDVVFYAPKAVHEAYSRLRDAKTKARKLEQDLGAALAGVDEREKNVIHAMYEAGLITSDEANKQLAELERVLKQYGKARKLFTDKLYNDR